ncbi:SPFH domain-containing protein [Cohnella nanjingensis]|uniref:SPFH domain-containing protein n=1 Tax=Cohnella nanjingensis TaxID=1387779 RepID=A0A7X0RT66_9BACL|nr:SPFH domain-containing protein [Cohnella nanjingensis]MBB6672031.1 SPFH domain-containing protein [Cohnella nanjingensis]
MAVVDVLKFEAPADVFAWKYPNSELGTWTQLIVHETQEAILFKGGRALDLFGPGRHTLETANIPLLQSLVNLPFGGKSPFAAEVWFVNKAHVLDVKWGTQAPLQLQDPKYQLFVAVRSFGQFGVQIEDSRKFLLKLIGAVPLFDREALITYFRGLLMMNINELISSYLVRKKVSILEINAYVGEIAEHTRERLAPIFEEYGIRLLNFTIGSINIPDNDPSTVKLKEALAKKAEMDIIGYTYQQERTFNTLEGAAKNEGSGSANVMGAGIGLGMGFGVGGAVGGQMAGLTQQMDTSVYNKKCGKCQSLNRSDAGFCMTCGAKMNDLQPAAPQEVECSRCGKSFPASAKFCPDCGDPNTPCPKCGADNAVDAAQCRKCGTSLAPPKACGKCGEKLEGDVKFCPNCGTSTAELRCGNCQHEVKPGQKFCLECGHNLTKQEE